MVKMVDYTLCYHKKNFFKEEKNFLKQRASGFQCRNSDTGDKEEAKFSELAPEVETSSWG